VERTPHHIALVSEEQAFTYRELNQRANQLAHHLQKAGLGAESLVGIAMERTADLLVAILGVWKSGAAYVPLDPAYPAERLSFMMEDADVSLILTQSHVVDRLPEHRADVLCLDGEWARIAQESTENVACQIGTECLAYVIYTSGSTGRPKGVMVTHRGLVNLAQAQNRLFGVTAASRFLQFASINFDASLMEILNALLCGARLVLAPSETAWVGEPLLCLLRDQGVTHMLISPSVLATLSPDDLPRLEVVISGGEACPADVVARWAQGRRFFNAYGPTEATICATVAELSRDVQRVTIGRPLANTRIFLLDRHLQPVPIGVPGEMYIESIGLARGYLNRPELTANAFVSHPFSVDAQARLYRTGDLARYLADGSIEYLGRIDHQVKIRGFRIELGEIESVLLHHPQVQEAIAIVREDVAGNKRLVTYVVGHDGAELAVHDLQSILKAHLPTYMVPSACVVLDRMPLTPNGKVDRQALPAPDGSQTSAAYLLPATPTQELVAGIWQDVLGSERVGIQDSFFELGGHSLLATQVLSRIRDCFAVEVPMRAFFDAPTVRELAEQIERLTGMASHVRQFPMHRRERSEQVPLSFAQQRLWFLEQFAPGSAVYNITIPLRIHGLLQREALERSLQDIVWRHEVLRTTFADVGGQAVQVIADSYEWSMPLIDLTLLPVEEREVQLERVVAQEAQRSFDLQQGPLFAGSLVRLDEEEHVLILNMHHIVSDGWSMDVLMNELEALYPAHLSGDSAALPELPLQYADFTVWQREWMQGDVLAEQLAYWKQQLAGHTVLQLPTDRPKPPVATYRGALVTRTLPAQTVQGLKAVSQREGTTLFMTLLAAYKTLLFRYSGQADISVGTPIAGRNRSEIEGLIGFFVNTLVLRDVLNGTGTFRELLHEVRDTALAAYSHQDLPFEKLVEELQPNRDLSQSPLFQVFFALQKIAEQSLNLPGLTVQSMDVDNGTAMFDLTLTMLEDADGLTAMLEYNVDLFEPDTIHRLMDHFQALLEGIIADAEQPLTMLPMLTEAERVQLVSEWNDTARPVPTDKAVYHLFEEQVTRTPESIALICGTERLTYRTLNERANQVAHYLRRLGVGPEVLVGLAMERSSDLIIALLGIWKAGGAYVPLDLAYPHERISFMLEDTGLSVVVTQSALAEQLPIQGAQVVCLDRDRSLIAEESVENPQVEVRPEHLAYVIYTSGSTGQPKGVQIEHKSLVNHNLAVIEQFELVPEDRVLAFATISFDTSGEEIYPTLLSGATLVLTTERVPTFGHFAQLIESEQVSVLNLPPAYWSEWCHEMKAKQQTVPSSVRLMVVGGEKVAYELYKNWRELAGDRIVFMNAYGLTETTITSTFYKVPAGELAHAELPIGKPLANTQLYILDANRNPVPVGVPGELYFGGDCLARGYLNRADLTAEKFVENPFATEPGARMYATGDVARYLPDGHVVYLGRQDNQVKIRGYRVELGEIEDVLTQHPQVRQAVVTLYENVSGVQHIAAYVLPLEAGSLTAPSLRTYVKERLPEYMVPTAVLLLEAFPLTPNGKVDRKALPTPESTDQSSAASYVAPRNQTEEMIAAVLASVLGLERVGIYDNFFEIGGHSLLATQVISRVRDLFGVELPLRVFFEQATVAEFGQRVQAAHLEAEGGRPVPPIERIARDGDLPLSFAQQRLWFLDRFEPNSALYNMIDVVRLEGHLHIAALEQSLNEIVRRHEALRTTFVEHGGTPMQRIHPAKPLVLTRFDLQDLPASERETRGLQMAKEDAMTPFDLTTDLLLRASLLQVDTATHLLVLTTHHIVNDGWSVGVFFAELAALYGAFTQGLPSPLPELPIQYADFAAWQRNWMQGQVLEEQLSYWKQHLSGELPVLQLPTDRPRPAKSSYQGSIHHIRLQPELSQALRRLSQREGVSLYMTLLAAFDTLLYRYTGQEDLLLGSAIANRNRGDIEGLIGFFVNTLALRTDLSGNPTFTELLSRVREVALGAFAHQDLPFEKLVEEVQPERDLSQSPLFRVLFVLQNAPMSELKLNDLSLNLLLVDNDTAKFDLMFSLEDREDGIAGVMQYDAELFDHATIDRMLAHFERLLHGIVANPSQPIAAIPMMSERERQQVLVEWNNTHTNYPRESTIHELFAEQAKQTPDLVAVESAGQTLTYSELNRRANQVARYLQDSGVQAGEKVGLCVERSLDLIISMLAILKAGACYVPLDPEYPTSRLSFMLEDTGVSVLLTHQHLQEKVPATDARLICLDLEATAIAGQCTEDLPVSMSADDLAYVIYTSGSTGRPKGVLVPHRGVVRLVTETNYANFTDEVFLQLAPVSFDAATFEVWGSLLNGSRLVVFPAGKPTLAELGRIVRESGVTTLWLTAGLFHMAAESDLRDFRGVRQWLAGGDVLSVPHVQKVLRELPNCRVINGYGPTESTTFTCCFPMSDPNQVGSSVPIGRPIANTLVYILDPLMQPVPIGVPGELYIGGDGLADGYLNLPELTAERFLLNPYASQSGARLYQTGDLVRYLPNGLIEFMGRIDQQVKIRGHRIELGEIEAVLGQHPNVRETVVLAREDEPGDKRLVAYVVPEYQGVEKLVQQEETEWQSEQVSEWEMLFDDYYTNQSANTGDDTFNIVGWNSSYTGQPIPAEEMREWLDHTIDRIRTLNTDRVLEIGCGTGMLLYRVAPHSRQYFGTDISSQVLRSLQQQLTVQPGDWSHVHLLHRPADNFAGVDSGAFDLVMLNSVIQYFPSIEYLVDVLMGAVQRLDGQGAIFLGDVRHLPLLPAFHTVIELHKAGDSMSSETLLQRIQQGIAQDNELVIDPAFFTAFAKHVPQISHVDVLVKRGHAHNELTQFRYDVILHVGTQVEASTEPVKQMSLNWVDDHLSVAAIQEALTLHTPDLLIVHAVPDARVYRYVQAIELLNRGDRPETVGELRAALEQLAIDDAVEPEALWALGESLQYHVEITRSTSATDGTYQVVFRNGERAVDRRLPTIATPSSSGEDNAQAPAWSRFANHPLQVKYARHLIPAYRNYLEEKLPDYMAPSAYVVLDALPLTANGKIDRKALPAPDRSRTSMETEFAAPSNEVEIAVAEIWQDILGYEQVGIYDNFFELGGHSLMATQMVSRLREMFEVEVPLQKVFEMPTVARLAVLVEEIIMAEIEALSEEEAAELLGTNES